VEDVGMKEAVYKMVDERTAVTEAYMPESTKETDDANRYFWRQVSFSVYPFLDNLYHTSCNSRR
jgi:hypothetical protein